MPWKITESNGSQIGFEGIDQSASTHKDPKPRNSVQEQCPFSFASP